MRTAESNLRSRTSSSRAPLRPRCVVPGAAGFSRLSPRAWLWLALSTGGLGAAALLWQQSASPVPLDDAARLETSADARRFAPPVATFTPAVALGDDRRARDANFRAVPTERGAALFEAEGVSVTQAGEVSLTSQRSGGQLSQRLAGAELHPGPGADSRAEAEPLPRAAVAHNPNLSPGHLRFAGFFAGLDLEYVYDGKDLEELLHVSTPLHERMQQEGLELRVQALLAGLSPTATNPNDAAALYDHDGQPLLVAGDKRALEEGAYAGGDVELTVGPHRYVLPAAFARDGGGQRFALARHFRFGEDGLEVRVHVPARVAREATAPLVIDPSVIDGARQLELDTALHSSDVVKDSTGRMHVAYRANVAGAWLAYYTSSSDGGLTWESPTRIAALGAGETRHYAPTLLLDSGGTLHALWNDIGQHSANAAQRGNASGSGFRPHYAQCPNRCRLKEWSYNGQPGGRVLLPSTRANLVLKSAVLDGEDTIHVTFEDYTLGVASTVRYGQLRQGVWSGDRARPPRQYSSVQGGGAATLVVDDQGQVHYFTFVISSGTGYHYAYDRSADAWQGGELFAFGRTGCYSNQGGAASMAVAPDGLHVAFHTDFDCGGGNATRTRVVFYNRFDLATSAWEATNLAPLVAPTDNNHHDNPVLTADDEASPGEGAHVHLLWRRQDGTRYSIAYAKRPEGFALGAPVTFVSGEFVPGVPVVRRKLAFPRNGTSEVVASGVLEVMLTSNQTQLMFFSTGLPLGGPQPLLPADATFVSSLTPTFSWLRLPGDDGSNVNYNLQVAPSPLFESPRQYFAGTNASFTLPSNQPLEEGFHYWRVQAIKEGFGPGPFGRIFELGVDVTPPQAFNLVAPADAVDPGTPTPTFEWQRASD